jgi:manganese/iron transport system substrate-binding protein
MSFRKIFPLLMVLVLLVSCAPQAAAGNGIKVVATTTIVADVVRQVGGDLVDVTTLLPAGTDPHSFEPRPQDAAAVADAKLVFANGAGLEEFLTPLVQSAGAQDRVVEVSQGITLLTFSEEVHGSVIGQDHTSGDPHTWTDPKNVMTWVENITAALSKLDPEHASVYRSNADAYLAQLRDLDSWIRQQVQAVPAERRTLVTDHAILGYFAKEYGFEQVGTISVSFSSMATPSAQELAALEDAVRQYSVPAIFVGNSVNPALAEQVASDTGVKLVTFYTGSLSVDNQADSYLKYMRYNVNAIVNALKP